MELDNTISTPLYQQLGDIIQEDIESGRLPAGARIPTEKELREQYNVSRVTVRKALGMMSDLGYLERKSGKGTFVAEKKIQRGLSSGAISFTDMCKRIGAVPGSKTTKIALEDPTPRDIELMKLKNDEKIVVLERIRYADSKPVILEANKFPEFFSFLFCEDLNNHSLYDILKAKHNIVLEYSSKAIDITFASSKEAKALQITKGYPLLRIDSVVHDSHNKITNLCQQLCIGDKFKFLV
ncbi:MAG: GntR family transcriptional regulator [Clostridiales bacterium]|nr:GntR family transcriptional regulator [Clostridiales bacterium]